MVTVVVAAAADAMPGRTAQHGAAVRGGTRMPPLTVGRVALGR